MAVQIIGAVAGVIVANLMFDEPAVFFSQKHRVGAGQWLGEFVATFGLLSVIQGCVRLRSPAVPFAVGGYITAAYWFTSSTSFANPAVTIARTLSDTFAGSTRCMRRRSSSCSSSAPVRLRRCSGGWCRHRGRACPKGPQEPPNR